MNLPSEMLVKLAKQCSSTWSQMAADAYRGDASFETGNALYRFHHGVFTSRSTKATGALEAPPSMQGLRLIGFLAWKDGLWSLSARWQKGSLAVMWRPGGTDERSFVVTSPTLSFSLVVSPARHSWFQRPAREHGSMTRVMASATADLR